MAPRSRDFTNSLIILIFCLFAVYSVSSQTAGKVSNEDLNIQDNQKDNMPKIMTRARIGEEYIRKFGLLSDKLAIKEDELESITYRIEAVKLRGKEVKAKEQKALFKENIKSLKLSEEKLESEVKLIKKALRILQENKSEADPQKMKALNSVAEIEDEIIALGNKLQDKRDKVVISKLNIDKRDVYLDPPKDECNIVFNGIDAVTQKPKKEVRKQFLFGYTHPKLKTHFKDEHFLSCSAKLVQINKRNYLWLYMTIASKDAIRTYGLIEKNSTIKFELISGDIIYLQSAQNASGQLEAYTGNTNYQIILPLDKSMYKQLSKSELDKVGIMWSSGYEEYEVYNVDLLMNQIECLNKN